MHADNADHRLSDPDPDDLGQFAEGVWLWSDMISDASLEKRADIFRQCVAEGATMVRKGARRDLIAEALIERVYTYDLLDALGGRNAVDKIIAKGLADADHKSPRQKKANGQNPSGAGLPLTYFDDCNTSVEKRSIIKGVIAIGETSAWIGPPGCGKSALLTEIVVHSAAKRNWRGHKAKEACGVLVIALERADLFKRRLHAYQLRDNMHGLPIAVAGTVIDLLIPSCVDLIVATVREAEQHLGCAIGMIVIDTYSKGIAAGGGDEDKARDQNRAAANLRNIHARLDVHIALVGHTGKDETRGARGSNAHLGDVDVMVQISGDTIRTAEVIKGNDTALRVIAQFKLEPFEFRRDEDGDPVETFVLSTEQFGGAPVKKKAKLPDKAKAALRVLFDCIADGNTMPVPKDPHIPKSVTSGTSLSHWRCDAQKRGILNVDGNDREEFKRVRVTLINAGFIGVWGDFVWPVT